jgi:phytoene dehydrogenase-like protein
MSYDVVVVGSGMGSLTAASLLAKAGRKVYLIEQNWIPGGCTTSYWRKGFVFEAGATTVVGMDDGMPLQYLLDEIGLEIPMRKLDLPMQVHMSDGRILNRFQNIESWIKEVSAHFGGDQTTFWRRAFEVSKFVWQASLKYQTFPPSKIGDLLPLIANASLTDIISARYAFTSTNSVLKKYGLNDPDFLKFVDEQLLITAQNKMEEVNFLFGAAALCYTNYQNLYLDGGLISLVKPIVHYIEEQGGKVDYRTKVQRVKRSNGNYQVETSKDKFKADTVVFGVPINNVRSIYPEIAPKTEKSVMQSVKLNSAFQMGIGFEPHKEYDSIHHQIHLRKPLPGTGSASIFLSLNHPDDKTRTDDPNHMVASISTHLPDPENNIVDSKEIEEAILNELNDRGFIDKDKIVYAHSSSPKSWNKWTGRTWGFVGGYPQFMRIKPWQMLDARLDQHKAYLTGDTAYPGQGIPGVTLSGIIAARKIMMDQNG